MCYILASFPGLPTLLNAALDLRLMPKKAGKPGDEATIFEPTWCQRSTLHTATEAACIGDWLLNTVKNGSLL